MEEAVIILSDLYPGSASRGGTAGPKLEGLRRVLRFGRHGLLATGWRALLAHWLGRPELASAAPAALAHAARPADLPAGCAALWLAQPVHLVAGLTSVYLGRRGLVRLDAQALERLCDDFDSTFAGSGYRLLPQPGGPLLCDPAPAGDVTTVEPARRLGGGVDGVLAGAGSARLRRLCTEVEMWLHEHPLNRRRERERLPPVSALWPWGGGAPLPPASAGGAVADAVVLGGDAPACGLAVLAGADCRPAARGAADILAGAAARGCAVVELFQLPGSEAAASVAECLEVFDRSFLLPLLAALDAGALGRLQLVANDRWVALRPRSRWRLWRRARDPVRALALEQPA